MIVRVQGVPKFEKGGSPGSVYRSGKRTSETWVTSGPVTDEKEI